MPVPNVLDVVAPNVLYALAVAKFVIAPLIYPLKSVFGENSVADVAFLLCQK